MIMISGIEDTAEERNERADDDAPIHQPEDDLANENDVPLPEE